MAEILLIIFWSVEVYVTVGEGYMKYLESPVA